MNSNTAARIIRVVPAMLAAAVLGACTTMPSGPAVLVLPGTGKSFDQFRMDDMDCRQYASAQIGGATSDVAADAGLRSAALGTVLGAAAGAAINGGRGAGVGAGAGLAMGGLAGTGAADVSARGAQRRYDISFLQCMYAKGHRVPVGGGFTPPRSSNYGSPPAANAPAPSGNPPPGNVPPPPMGNPPPPPPGGLTPPPR